MDKALSKYPQIKAILDHALHLQIAGKQLIVIFETGSIWVEMFQDKRVLVEELLAKHFKNDIKVLVQEEEKGAADEDLTQEAPTEIPADPVVRQAVEILNATVKEVKKF